jgi:PadR family transcriptional regulator, regulatory protein AphA
MSRPVGELTTTSYALLSHLAMKPWSAYELAVQRQRYFRYFWPRAQRGLYTELKRLTALGYTDAETAHTGRRARTVYSITERGREALRGWLVQPLTPIALEFEGLLRIFASPLGTKEQLLRTLAQLRIEVDEMTAFNDGIAQEYIDGRAPFQHQAYVRTLVVDFITDWMAAIDGWLERTTAEVKGWEDLSPEGKQERARARLLAARRRAQRRHVRRGD